MPLDLSSGIAQLELDFYRCECCKRTVEDDQDLTPSMTCYAWDGKGEDPNRPFLLCEECAEEHVEHWSNMWGEYYASII